MDKSARGPGRDPHSSRRGTAQAGRSLHPGPGDPGRRCPGSRSQQAAESPVAMPGPPRRAYVPDAVAAAIVAIVCGGGGGGGGGGCEHQIRAAGRGPRTRPAVHAATAAPKLPTRGGGG